MSTVSQTPPQLSVARITVVICVAEILGMAGFAAFATLLPTFLAEWHLSNTDGGWITGIYYAGYVVSVIVLTSLTDRIAPRDIYVSSMCIAASACAGFAWFADGFWTAVIFQTMGGIGLAGTYMPGLKMLSDFLQGSRQSRFVAFYTASFAIGTSTSILATGLLSDLAGWRTAFALLTLGPVCAIFLSLIAIPRRRESIGTRPKTHVLDFRPVLRCRPAMAYVMAYTIHNFELFAMRAWIVAFLVFALTQHPGQSVPVSIAVIASIINLCGVPASIFGNEFAIRMGRHRWATIVMLSSAVVACGIGFASAWSFWVLIVMCCVYSMTISGDSATLTAGAVESAPPGYRGATMAVYSSIAFLGAFLGPLAMGAVLDVTGGGQTPVSWGMAFIMVGFVVCSGPLFLRWLGK